MRKKQEIARAISTLRLGTILLVSLVMVFLSFGYEANAGTWPRKAIKLVVSFAPGGGSDVAGRVMAKALSAELKVPVNVMNQPGGNQIPAIMEVMNAPADGYTLLLDQPANSSIHSAMPDLPYKLEERSFGPMMVTGPNSYAINGKAPQNSLKEFIDYYKKNPEQLTWSMAGYSLTYFANMQLFMVGGIDVAKTKPVQTTGVGPGNTAVAGGHIVLAGGGAGSVVPLYKSGHLKVLAVTGDRRVPVLSDVPSAKELGLELTMMNWYSMSGPKGLPKEVIVRLEEAAKKISTDPTFEKENTGAASYPIYMSGADTKAYIFKEVEHMKKLAAAIGAIKK
jgi:tripartite-type tricarboxylate transporter receptor subunit TctC